MNIQSVYICYTGYGQEVYLTAQTDAYAAQLVRERILTREGIEPKYVSLFRCGVLIMATGSFVLKNGIPVLIDGEYHTDIMKKFP